MSVKNVVGTVKQPSLRGTDVVAALVAFGARVVGSVVAVGADVTAGVDGSAGRAVGVLSVLLLPSAQATRATGKAAASGLHRDSVPVLGSDVADRLGELPPVAGEVLRSALPLAVLVVGRLLQHVGTVPAGALELGVNGLDAHLYRVGDEPCLRRGAHGTGT